MSEPEQVLAGLQVLVVDDQDQVRGLLEAFVSVLGGQALAFDSPAACLAALDDLTPDLLLTDFSMPDMDGVALLVQVRARFPWLPVVICTGYPDEVMLDPDVHIGVQVLAKPLQLADLLAALRAARAQAPDGVRGTG